MKPFATACCCLFLTLFPAVASAIELTLPAGARQLTTRDDALDSYDLPVGPFQAGNIPVQEVEGRVERATWRVALGSMTSLQVLAPLRDQLIQGGFDVVFECRDTTCGGFDFRFGTEVIPAPDMQVDMRDFRFLSATKAPGTVVSLLVSKSRSETYIQKIQVTSVDAPPIDTAAGQVTDAPIILDTPDEMISRLLRDGHVVLEGLEFGSSAANLGKGPYQSLAVLTNFLKDQPEFTVVLVGHTDSVGNLASNIALSKKRAQSVRRRMLETYGAPQDRLLAEGNGYLAPRATNLTPQGREANRRVEAILLPNS